MIEAARRADNPRAYELHQAPMGWIRAIISFLRNLFGK
jgi:hypothetical protein